MKKDTITDTIKVVEKISAIPENKENTEHRLYEIFVKYVKNNK